MRGKVSFRTALFVLSLMLFLGSNAGAFSLLGTDANLNLTGNLPLRDAFRWNGVPALGPQPTPVKTIYYRIDPAFTNAERGAIQNAFNTWNAATAVQPNITQGGWPRDFESVTLHEIGHTLGLAHPGIRENAANANYDTDNNPFNPMVNPDITNLNQSPNRPINPNFPGPGTAAVMTYDANIDNLFRRNLAFDDVGGLNYAETGPDNLNNGGLVDDFFYLFLLDPLAPFGVVPDLAGPDGLFATEDDWDVSWIGGPGMAQPQGGMLDIFKHHFTDGTWGLADVVFDRNNLGGAGPLTIWDADIYLDDSLNSVPEPSSILLLGSGLIGVCLFGLRKKLQGEAEAKAGGRTHRQKGSL